jgi:anti-sigma factor ChrR (cupin superfamily)
MSELPDRRELSREDLELAALLALGALEADECRALERERGADPAFWAEARSLAPAVEHLARAAGPHAPTRDLLPEILARIQTESAAGATPEGRSQVWKHWEGEWRADTVRRGGQDDFEPTDVPGIRVRRLFVDIGADRVTMLVRMAPGTSYPAHRHGGAEECFVLEGDLEVGPGTVMAAGDYQRMDAGSRHPVQSTRGGCLLLISSSRRDELEDDR